MDFLVNPRIGKRILKKKKPGRKKKPKISKVRLLARERSAKVRALVERTRKAPIRSCEFKAEKAKQLTLDPVVIFVHDEYAKNWKIAKRDKSGDYYFERTTKSKRGKKKVSKKLHVYLSRASKTKVFRFSKGAYFKRRGEIGRGDQKLKGDIKTIREQEKLLRRNLLYKKKGKLIASYYDEVTPEKGKLFSKSFISTNFQKGVSELSGTSVNMMKCRIKLDPSKPIYAAVVNHFDVDTVYDLAKNKNQWVGIRAKIKLAGSDQEETIHSHYISMKVTSEKKEEVVAVLQRNLVNMILQPAIEQRWVFSSASTRAQYPEFEGSSRDRYKKVRSGSVEFEIFFNPRE